MDTIKRLTALLMTLTMTLSLLAGPALAAESTEAETALTAAEQEDALTADADVPVSPEETDAPEPTAAPEERDAAPQTYSVPAAESAPVTDAAPTAEAAETDDGSEADSMTAYASDPGSPELPVPVEDLEDADAPPEDLDEDLDLETSYPLDEEELTDPTLSATPETEEDDLPDDDWDSPVLAAEDLPDIPDTGPQLFSLITRESKTVERGKVRYVSQKSSSKYYYRSYWGKDAGDSQYLCKSADVSMMLSFLGINYLPAYINTHNPPGGDKNCMERDWGKAKVEKHLKFTEAVENYLFGNRTYSPVMIKIKNDCFKKSQQHFVIVTGRKSAKRFYVTDPYQDKAYLMKLAERKGQKGFWFKWRGEWHWSPFSDIYQYHLEQNTNVTAFTGPGNCYQGASFTPRAWLFGSKVISNIRVTVTDMNGKVQSGCSWSIKPNRVFYRLSWYNKQKKFRLDQLKPGIYQYEIWYRNKGGAEKRYVRRTFTVLGKKANMGTKAAFYLDSCPNRKYCVMPAGGSKANHKSLTLTYNNEKVGLRFKAHYVGKGFYLLTNESSQKLLTAVKSKSGGLSLVQKSRSGSNGSAAQQWQIIYLDKGANQGITETYYYLVPRCAPQRSITIPAGQATKKPTLQLATVTPSTVRNQKWILRPVRTQVTQVSNTQNGLKVSWKPVTNAASYQIRRNKKVVHTVKAGKGTSWVDTKVSNGSAPTYTVVTRYGSGSLKSFPSPGVSCTRLTAPKLGTVASKKARTVSVSWQGNSKATSYQVKLTGRSPRTCTGTHTELSGLSPNRSYRVKVRAVRREKGRTVYSAWSGEKKVTVRK